MRPLRILAASLWAGSSATALPPKGPVNSLIQRGQHAPVSNTTFTWSSTGPLIAPKNDSRSIAGIKDPTIIHHKGTYHVFASTAKSEGYNMVYLNFTSFSDAASTPFTYLDQTPIGTGYRAAPQVFYFTPQKLWYLVYQDGNAAYSTNPDISNPAGWTAPQTFYPAGMPATIAAGIGEGYWVDMWVICEGDDDDNHGKGPKADKKKEKEDKKCHLFSSDDNGHLYRSETKLEDFPAGMSEPVVALADTENKYALYEASMVYAVRPRAAGPGQKKNETPKKGHYMLVIEAIGANGDRYFRAWTSSKIESGWTPLADTEANPFAGASNVVFEKGVAAWTESVSHGELVRTAVDETMTIEPCGWKFLYQGMDSAAKGGEYNALPWRLGLLTQTNPTC